MTNREFLRQLLEVPRVSAPEADLEFIFRAGQYLGRPEEPFDYEDWLDQTFDRKRFDDVTVIKL